jgi:hypothetical protein
MMELNSPGVRIVTHHLGNSRAGEERSHVSDFFCGRSIADLADWRTRCCTIERVIIGGLHERNPSDVLP